MMIYHGSLDIVSHPEIRPAGHTLDYGCGFYATTSREQAVRFVRRRMWMNKADRGFLNIYELDEHLIKELDCLIFTQPDETWVDFVMANRIQKGFCHSHDIVFGPVANDHVYTAFSLYEQHVLSKKGLIDELRTQKLVDQYLFHTESALKAIRFVKAEEILSC